MVATGRLTTFPAASKYQIVVEALAPAGVGALMAMLEARKQALAAEGLFDAGRKRPLPYLPEVIGVVTSPSGAVIRDILHRLRERFPRPVLLWPVTVQGERCAPEVAAAIRGFNAHRARRAGAAAGRAHRRPRRRRRSRISGAFNEEIVVRAAAESRIPLISAVGHETDTTLIDFAADRRAPTPTAAAEMAVPVRLDLLAALAPARASAGAAALARGLGQRGPAAARPRARAAAAGGAGRPSGRSGSTGSALRLPRALTGFVRDRQLRLEPRRGRAAWRRAARRSASSGGAQRLMRAEARLTPGGVRPRLERLRRAAGGAGGAARSGRAAADRARRGRGSRRWRGRWRASGRTQVLARGFAIVRDGGGAVLTGAAAARAGAGAGARVRRRPGAGAARSAEAGRAGGDGSGTGDAVLKGAGQTADARGRGSRAARGRMPAELEHEAGLGVALDQLRGEAAGARAEAPALRSAAVVVEEADPVAVAPTSAPSAQVPSAKRQRLAAAGEILLRRRRPGHRG